MKMKYFSNFHICSVFCRLIYMTLFQVTIKFGTRVDDLIEEGGHLTGVKVSDSRDKLKLSKQKLGYDAIVLAVGHSARDVYQMLLSHNIPLIPKEFAVSFFLIPLVFWITLLP